MDTIFPPKAKTKRQPNGNERFRRLARAEWARAVSDYRLFLENKRVVDVPTGLTEIPLLSPHLFDFQRDVVRWALQRGRATIFADCGLGKTLMQLDWAKHVPGDVLHLTPLAVAAQTVREGEKFGIPVRYVRDQSQVQSGISVANYEMLEHFDPDAFTGIVLDESRCVVADFSLGWSSQSPLVRSVKLS